MPAEVEKRPEVEARDTLLAAAERLFAERGFDGASVRDITAAAGCNVAAVNYYFGGKEALYREVFCRGLAGLREQRVRALERALATAGESADVALVVRTFTAAFLEPLVDESEGRLLVALISREMMNPRLPREVFLEHTVLPVQEALAAALRQVAPELSDKGLRLSVHSLVAQLAHVVHLSVGRVFGAAGAEPLEGISLAEMVDHIVAFSTAGIAALAGERR